MLKAILVFVSVCLIGCTVQPEILPTAKTNVCRAHAYYESSCIDGDEGEEQESPNSEKASPKKEAENQVPSEPEAPSGPKVVEFRIEAGTGRNPWNRESERLVVTVGDTLKICNDDDINHQVHANGRPFSHPRGTIRPGECQETLVRRDCDRCNTYDHETGSRNRFYLRALPAVSS